MQTVVTSTILINPEFSADLDNLYFLLLLFRICRDTILCVFRTDLYGTLQDIIQHRGIYTAFIWEKNLKVLLLFFYQYPLKIINQWDTIGRPPKRKKVYMVEVAG